MRYFTLLLSAVALYATPQLRLSTSTVGPLNIAVGQNGPLQTVTTSNIGDGTLQLSASASVPWINPTIGGGGVLLALNTSTLAQGIFTGLVTVTAANAIDSPQTIAVTVQMGGGVPSALSFYVAPGGSASTSFVASDRLTTSIVPAAGVTLSIAAQGGGSFQTTGSYLVTTSAPAATTPETSYTGTLKVTASNFAPDVKNVPVTINVTAMPIATPLPASLQFNVGQGAAAVTKWVQMVNSGASGVVVSGATVSTTATAGAAWLTATVSGTIVSVVGNPTGLTAGKYTATVTIATNAKNGPFAVPVEMDVVATTPPVSYYQGVEDNALYKLGATVSPGDLVIVRGDQFTTGAAVSATQLPLGTTLGGATVYVNGAAVPIDYVSASHVLNQGGQIIFQIPYSTPAGQALVRVDRNDNGTVQTGNTISMPVLNIVPRLLQFTLNTSGYSLATASNNIVTATAIGQTYASATFSDLATFPIPTTAGIPSRPAKSGDVLVFYGLGFGKTVPPVTEGIAVVGQTNIPNAVMVFGGQDIVEGANKSAVPSYCGLTPGSVGLYQVNVTVPVGVETGTVPVFLTIGAATSNAVMIAIQ
jgi:uncharacterized protein (TIGR03437 family)